MKSIKEITIHTIIIKKSEFICTLVPVSNESEVKDLLQQYGKEDATHNCYAYIIGPHERASDDGEPSSTAGLPMLNVLKMQGLDNILAIVTRYFGGIKLGAGGLTRAYTQSVAETLKEAEIVEKELVPLYRISLDYSFTKRMDYMMKTHSIKCMNLEYSDQVIYDCFIKEESFIKEINEMTSGNVEVKKIKEDYIEKTE